jgi:hypothetical protein
MVEVEAVAALTPTDILMVKMVVQVVELQLIIREPQLVWVEMEQVVRDMTVATKMVHITVDLAGELLKLAHQHLLAFLQLVVLARFQRY